MIIDVHAKALKYEEDKLAKARRVYERALGAEKKNLNSIPSLEYRVWLWRFLQMLVEQGMVRCNDLRTLEAECLDIGNSYMQGAAVNGQPRPTVVSSISS